MTNIRDIRDRICSGKMTAQEVAKFWLNRAENLDKYNAFSSINRQHTIDQAIHVDEMVKTTGACPELAGVPFAIKDNIDVEGYVNTGGTYALRHYRPKSNSKLIEKILSAGGVILGKTSMQELAFGISGYNPNYQSDSGVGVKNAHNTTKIAGGSSSGSGAAVGANIAPIAIGTDTGGSVSIPSALNGCVGFRPTTLRYPTDGIIPISFSRDTPGTMAHSVADIITVDNVITGIKALPQYSKIRLGMPSYHWSDLDKETAQRSRDLIETLNKSGIEVVDVELEGATDLANKFSMPVAIYEAREELIRYLKETETGITIEQLGSEIKSPDVYTIINDAVIPLTFSTNKSDPSLESLYIEGIKKYRPALLRVYEKTYEENQIDALIFPTTPQVAIDSNAEASSPQNFSRVIRNTDMGSNIRLPAITLPMGLGPSSKLPIGISIESLPNHDRNVLAIAQVVESIISKKFK
ncbi:amidase family protein [Marinomonas spartinae]|uniref:amidase family protein n=1 Tax=Marinomonas spartinae TaxID=1792290 RepID=UPI0018F1FE20|nr:amidase family protein [Marinomonas spartinae]MBJ7554366.1 hypothetical protein [Marinomonas spartinae]